eukprot:COSAG06_NODE_2516_length_6733_cov_25.155261_5_plen_91_part_00
MWTMWIFAILVASACLGEVAANQVRYSDFPPLSTCLRICGPTAGPLGGRGSSSRRPRAAAGGARSHQIPVHHAGGPARPERAWLSSTTND